MMEFALVAKRQRLEFSTPYRSWRVLGRRKWARIFLLSYSVTDIEIPADLTAEQFSLIPRSVLDCGRNKQVDALRSNQLRLVSVASLPK